MRSLAKTRPDPVPPAKGSAQGLWKLRSIDSPRKKQRGASPSVPTGAENFENEENPVSTSTKTQQPEAAIEQVFDLDVTQVEIADPAGLVNVTDDGCGSTCGACNSTVA